MEINIIILNLCGTTYYKITSNDNSKKKQLNNNRSNGY